MTASGTLGQWLYGQERKDAEAAVPAIAPMLKELERHHAELHASAVDIGAEFTQAHTGLTQKPRRSLEPPPRVGQPMRDRAYGRDRRALLLPDAHPQRGGSGLRADCRLRRG